MSKQPFLILRPLRFVPLNSHKGHERALVIMEGGLARPHWAIFRVDLEAFKSGAIPLEDIHAACDNIKDRVAEFMQLHDLEGFAPAGAIPQQDPISMTGCKCPIGALEGANFSRTRHPLA